VFNVVPRTWRFPLPRLSAVKSKHSFQAGVLLRAGIDSRSVDRFVDELFGASWGAVRFRELREDSVVYRQLQESAQRRGLSWFVDRRYTRASLKLGNDSAWRDHISSSRHRKLRSARRKLAGQGKLEFRIAAPGEISESTTDTFLRLESMGWKSESALLAKRNDTLFFREMARGCREQGLLFFCELVLNGTVIASVANLRVNGSGFAFKTGYDPAYAKLSPGLLLQYSFLESLADAGACVGLKEIESGSWAGSFIEELWPERIPIVSGHFFAGKLPSVYASLRHRLKVARSLTLERLPA
jgi:CelD/BcsL family acetyltransferase involved in cellulose biosynthesis